MEETKLSPYVLGSSLSTLSSVEEFASWLKAGLFPYLEALKGSAGTPSRQQQIDSLLLRTLKTASKIEAEPIAKNMLEWICVHYQTVGTCNILWHYIEWLDCSQSMLFEAKTEIGATFKKNIKEYSANLIFSSEEKLFGQNYASAINCLHYLNLHLVLSEFPAFSVGPGIFTFLLSRVAELWKLLNSSFVAALSSTGIKLVSCIQNCILKVPSLAKSFFAGISQIVLSNSVFAQIFTVLARSEGESKVLVRFSEREQMISVSALLNLVLTLLRAGIVQDCDGSEIKKIANVYHQFFDSHKDGVLKLMSVSDSCFVSFLHSLLGLDAALFCRGTKLFDTPFISLEYIVRAIDRYGEDDWCRMSIDYLLEDATFLEFLVLLLDYLKEVPAEVFAVRFSSIRRFVEELEAKLESYSQKSIFPYNLIPLIHKMKTLLGK